MLAFSRGIACLTYEFVLLSGYVCVRARGCLLAGGYRPVPPNGQHTHTPRRRLSRRLPPFLP